MKEVVVGEVVMLALVVEGHRERVDGVEIEEVHSLGVSHTQIIYHNLLLLLCRITITQIKAGSGTKCFGVGLAYVLQKYLRRFFFYLLI